MEPPLLDMAEGEDYYGQRAFDPPANQVFVTLENDALIDALREIA